MRLDEIFEDTKPELLKKKIVLKDGSPAILKIVQGSYGPKVEVWSNRKLAGTSSFGSNDYMSGYEGTFSATDTFVNAEWRRKGVNTAMYDAMEELGYHVVPEPRYNKRTDDANAFWQNRKSKIIETTDRLTLYHGTCPENGETLCKNGWSPNSGSIGGNMGQTRYLYLTTHPENAEWFANEKGCSTILSVSVPKEYLAVDPEDGTGDTVDQELNSKHGLPGLLVLTRALGPEHFNVVQP